jgi:hypothetical protein
MNNMKFSTLIILLAFAVASDNYTADVLININIELDDEVYHDDKTVVTFKRISECDHSRSGLDCKLKVKVLPKKGEAEYPEAKISVSIVLT